MALLTEKYIKECDIDWFCLIKGIPTHIASMGGMIPQKFCDVEKLRHNQDMVARMESFCEAVLNIKSVEEQTAEGYDYLEDNSISELIEKYNNNNLGFLYLNNYDLRVKLYASTFIEKARRGFRSFAKGEGLDADEYILIAEPDRDIDSDFFNDILYLEELECEQDNDSLIF